MQYRVSGPDVDQVRAIALKLAQIIATNPKAEKVNFDWIEPARQVRIRVDQDEARLLGLSSQALASVLNTVISGTSVTQVRDDIYLVDVIARATDEQRVSLATLRTLQVPLPGGRTVPLSQFATFEYGQEYPLIWRRDRVPTLTVQADIVAGALPETVVTSLSPDGGSPDERPFLQGIISLSAGLSKRARNRRPPSSPSCRSCCSSCSPS